MALKIHGNLSAVYVNELFLTEAINQILNF